MSGFLNFKMAPWKRSCVTRTVAIVPTLVIAVVFQASHKLDQLNQLLNILQSIMLPFAIIPVSMSASLPSVWVEPVAGLLISVCIGIAVPDGECSALLIMAMFTDCCSKWHCQTLSKMRLMMSTAFRESQLRCCLKYC